MEDGRNSEDNDLKSLCQDLAETLDSPFGPKVLSLLRKISINKMNLKEDEPSPKNAAPTLRFGIWEGSTSVDPSERVFKRLKESKNEFGLWANIEQIGPKRKGVPRVLFFGESVARGFFYEPFFCPAMVLQDMLRKVPGLEECEIIDLARIDQGIEDLSDIVSNALVLQPDAIVIMSGNNWRIPPDFVASEMLTMLSEGQSLEKVSFRMQRQLKNLVTSFFQELSDLVTPLNIPVITAVTDFNLADYDPLGGRDDDPPFLRREDLNSEWKRESKAALKALDEGHYKEAITRAHKLLKLDRGTSGLGFKILGRCALASGETVKARRYLERAKDAQVFLGSGRMCPAPNFISQRVMRRIVTSLGLTLVDLPQEFDQKHPGKLPGLEYYLDYCHLTARGMIFSMAAIAKKLSPVLSGSPTNNIDFESIVEKPTSSVEAHAHFLAAIHNTHWGQPPDPLLEYQCRKSFELYENISTLFSQYILYKTKYADCWLSGPLQDVLTQNPALTKYLGGRFRQILQLDMNMVDIMAEILIAARKPLPIQIQEERIRNFDVTDSGSNLLELQDFRFNSLFKNIGFFRSCEQSSSFSFLANGKSKLSVELTFRVPLLGGSSEKIQVDLNGEAIFELEPSVTWQTVEKTIPMVHLKSGRNVLSVVWPTPKCDMASERIKIIRDLEDGLAPKIHPVFGEIHKLIARAIN